MFQIDEVNEKIVDDTDTGKNDLLVDKNSSDVDNEIDDAMKDSSSIKYVHPIKHENQNCQAKEINYSFDSLHYKLNNSSPLESLDIEIGGNKIGRFSCGNHKLNLAVRHAIQLHKELSTILFNLNKSNSHIRNTINLNKV